MSATSDEYTFLATIDRLRTQEALVLQPVMPTVSEEDIQDVGDYLEREYEREQLEYPHGAPPYEAAAARWAARLIFYAGHLLLHRTDLPESLSQYLTAYPGPLSHGAILSADLCLRFLPDLLQKGHAIDTDDELLPLLEEILRPFGYSGLGYFEGRMEVADWMEDACLRQLCLDRIIGLQLGPYLEVSPWQGWIMESLGGHAATYWPKAAKLMES